MDKESLYIAATQREKLWVQLVLVLAECGDVDSLVTTYRELRDEGYNNGWEDALYEKGTRI